jgi:hypothetical protein
MFFFDPARGNRRRALVRDQLNRFSHRTGEFIDKAVRDAEHRIEGTLAEVSSAFHTEAVEDDVLVQRVRSKIGRFVSHPKAIEVAARDGQVVLSGAVLQQEVPGLLSAVWRVRGVRDVKDQTTPHAEAGNIADLQGGRFRSGDRAELLQANWAPATRLFMGGVGTWLMLNCLARRNLSSIAWGTIGFGLVMASAANCNAGERGSTARQETGNGRRRWEPSMASAESGMH